MCALVRNDISFTPHPKLGAVLFLLDIHGRIHEVYILGIQLLAEQFHGFSKALEVDHLALPEELNDIVYIWVVTEAKDVVIGDSGFLLCCNHVCKTFLGYIYVQGTSYFTLFSEL